MEQHRGRFPARQVPARDLRRTGGAEPDAIALVYEDCTISYAELNRRANQLARYLRTLGVGPESLVAICAERSVEMVVALLGVVKAGGAYVPLDPTYPTDRLGYMLEDSAPVALFSKVTWRDVSPGKGRSAT